MMKGKAAKLILVCICTIFSVSVNAELIGMDDIRYQLFKDDQINMEPEVRVLADAGAPDAQALLADLLSENSSVNSLKEASYWYQHSYQGGKGVARSVRSLARLSDQYEWLSDYNEAFYQDLNDKYNYLKDSQSVISGLEIFITYPQFFSQSKVQQLIELHKGVCIDDCQFKLFKAVALANFDSLDSAQPYFLEASKVSTRAIRIYFDTLPEKDKFKRFSQFASQLKENIASIEPASKFSVANRLRSLSSDFNQEVIFWLDQAIEDGLEDGYEVRAEYMLSYPLNFSYQETEKVINRVAQVDAKKGLLLEASLYTVREWKKLQPVKAYQILSKLDSEGVTAATIGLGDLFSMGGLDQVDQPQAINTYLRAAKEGSSVGYQKIANIYRGGRGIVNDKAKAFGYSKLAAYLGNDASNTFLESLKEEMEPEEVNSGEKAYQNYLKIYVTKGEARL